MPEKILVVDDDLDTLRLVGLLLQRKGYAIIAADNGVQAIEKARHELPDLILLDVMMPEMDGIEVLRRLRSHTETAETPVIMFTAKTQVDDKVTGFEAGADDYLTKPTHPAELAARVRTILSRTAHKRQAATNIENQRSDRGRVISIVGAKGGLGVSTIALNTAYLLQSAGRSTVLADLRPGASTLGLMIGLDSNGQLTAILRKDAGAITDIDLRNAVTRIENGPDLLLASTLPVDARYAAAADQMAAAVDRLARLYDYVVVDLGPGLPPGSAKVVEKSDQLVVVTEPVPQTLTQTRLLLDELRMKVLGLGAIQVVLVSRSRVEGHIPLRDVQNRIGHPVAVSISPAPDLAFQSLVENRPFVRMPSAGALTQQLQKIAEAITAA